MNERTHDHVWSNEVRLWLHSTSRQNAGNGTGFFASSTFGGESHLILSVSL
jgi:hypothetical protein